MDNSAMLRKTYSTTLDGELRLVLDRWIANGGVRQSVLVRELLVNGMVQAGLIRREIAELNGVKIYR